MKIGIDVRFWQESGVGRYIRNLTKSLAKIDNKNTYYIFARSSDLKAINEEIKAENFIVVPCDIPWHSLSEQVSMPSFLGKYNLDLMHFPYFSLPIFYKGPYVVTIHDLILHHFSSGKATTLPLPMYKLKRAAYKLIMHESAKRARKIITVSNTTKDEIVEHLDTDPAKVVVAYEGADDFKKFPYKKTHENYFLYVGNTYPHKNVEVLFFAFSALDDAKVKLFVVGKEDYFQKAHKKNAEQGFRNPNILFKEDVDDRELYSLYKNALSLVSPSLMEGFGLPVLEAMQSGCLVLAADIPAYRELAADAALYFDPRSYEDLSAKMHNVLKGSAELGRLKEKGKERARLFSWDEMGKQTLEVYREVLVQG